MFRTLSATLLLALIASVEGTAADVVLENARFKAVLSEKAVWQSFVDKATGKEYCTVKAKLPLSTALVEGKTRRANRLSFEGDRLVVGFADCDTQLTYAVISAPDWIGLKLLKVEGVRPSHLTPAQLAVDITEHAGSRLGAAWNDEYTICLRGVNLQAGGTCSPRKGHALIRTFTQDEPGPKLEGTTVAFLAAPTAEVKPLLQKMAVAFDSPRNANAAGVQSRDLPIARQSYMFLSFSEKDVDKVIECCELTGFKQVMMGFSSWCTSAGHYPFNTSRYPDGIKSLRRTIDKLHEHGILVGMHTFVSKVAKRDTYVTPIPDRRFWVDMTATLAGDLDAKATEIRASTDLSQWPGSPACKKKVWEGHVSKHQEVIIDDEIIRFETIGPEGKWDTFLGCKRGSWGTKAAAHKAQTECRHYGVDGCINGYIIDQDTDLMEEVAGRLAKVFNEAGFDMVYFDGSEDVPRTRYNYYSANAHATAMRKFTKRPLLHKGGGFDHGVWNSFTCSGTIDQYPGTQLAYLHAGGTIKDFPTCKDHIDRSVRSANRLIDEMTPGELGWFGLYTKRKHSSGLEFDGLQLDEIEYLMCKSLAYNAPISLQTSHAVLTGHPLSPGILAIVRTYETLRLGGKVPRETCLMLRERQKDFIMLDNGEGQLPDFVPVEGLPKVGGTHDVRAFVGPHKGGAVATVWHYQGNEGTLTLDTKDVKALDFPDTPVKLETAGGKTVVPISNRRTTLFFPTLDIEAAKKLLSGAVFEPRKLVTMWIQAEDCVACVGKMAKGADCQVKDEEALGDFITCTDSPAVAAKQPWYCEYRVEIPHKGQWTLWGRVRYPRGGDMSFGLVVPGEDVTLRGRQVLGNCGTAGTKWHWTGRGGGSTSPPPGSPIVFNLKPGPFVFRIYAREGSSGPANTPRLDLLCLTEDTSYIPTDADVKD